ncbi:SDR family NAD(P)-dependent oxidoreductase [Myxococcaceae bacterium GXIMD 01537]
MSLPPQPRAVVTGAGSGLGRALCLELARRRARVMVSDLDATTAGETARLVTEAGGEAHVVPCDVTKAEQVQALADAAFSTLGGVDLLINNAGVASGGEVGTLPLDAWRFVLDVNLWGVIHGCHTFAPRLRQQGSGHVLNIASLAGLVSAPYLGPYNASKAAVVALSETLSIELQRANVGVTVACPLFFATNIAKSARFTEGNASLHRAFQRLTDQGLLTAEEVARRCLAAVDSNTLYALPMAQGGWLWRLKRLAPGFFVRTTPVVTRWVLGRGKKPRKD